MSEILFVKGPKSGKNCRFSTNCYAVVEVLTFGRFRLDEVVS